MSSQIVNICYPIENYLKLLFIPMAVINANGTIAIAFLITIMAILRVCKRPQFTKEYAQRVLLNNHGQNLMYIGIGAMGYTNFLYYSPLMLFFAFGFTEFVNQKYPNTKFSEKYMPYVNLMRNQKFYIMEGKAKLEIASFVFLICTVPLDFFNRLLKVFIMGQYLLMKFRISQEFRYGCSEVHKLIDSKTKSIGFVNSLYNKGVDFAYKMATSDPNQQQAQQPQQPQQQ